MPDKALLQISEYSNKYGISLSTIRRRIKAGEVEYEFDQGKYWLKDEPIARYIRNRPRAKETKPITEAVTPIETTTSFQRTPVTNERIHIPETGELKAAINDVKNFTSSAKEMMSEVKSAFIKALQEKEEQILELKEEVADLRTLNRILDQENERLKKSSFSEWIETNQDL